MNWKNLKTFAIAVLLILDMIFVYCVAERKYAMMYYDDSQISYATTIFRTSNLYVDRAFLKEKKQFPSVYTGNMDAESFSFLTETMENEGYDRLEEPNGLSFFGKQGEFFFGNSFSFSYRETGCRETPSLLLLSGEYHPVEHTGGNRNAEEAVTTFLKRYSLIFPESTKYVYEDIFYECFLSGEDYIVHMIQTIDGLSLENGVYFLVKDGRVVSADGFFAVLPPMEEKTSQTAGLMNILFAEKAYLENRRKGSTYTREFYVVTDISYSYGFYFDADGTFYLVPLCTIDYRNGETRSYNFISAELYS